MRSVNRMRKLVVNVGKVWERTLMVSKPTDVPSKFHANCS